jgi:hypothetical protein
MQERISIMAVAEQFIRDSSERVALIVNVSGGKDSTRMLGFIRSQFPDSLCFQCHCNTCSVVSLKIGSQL